MAEALARITELTDLGMIQIRADLDRAGDAIAGAAGLAVPAQTSATADGSRTLLWMSPDELLLVLPRAETAGALTALTDALATEHSLVLDVSDMRAAFAVVRAERGAARGRRPDRGHSAAGGRAVAPRRRRIRHRAHLSR